MKRFLPRVLIAISALALTRCTSLFKEPEYEEIPNHEARAWGPVNDTDTVRTADTRARASITAKQTARSSAPTIENPLPRLRWPLKKGRITSEFGWRRFSFHDGLDLSAPQGTPIYAAHAGEVIFSGVGLTGYGKMIVIKGERLYTIYAHNYKNYVSAGDFVGQGEEIGQVGQTGKATGPHVHFETRIKNPRGKLSAVNPRAFLPK